MESRQVQEFAQSMSVCTDLLWKTLVSGQGLPVVPSIEVVCDHLWFQGCFFSMQAERGPVRSTKAPRPVKMLLRGWRLSCSASSTERPSCQRHCCASCCGHGMVPTCVGDQPKTAIGRGHPTTNMKYTLICSMQLLWL